jgi:uncharacterized protein (DUF885 family)
MRHLALALLVAAACTSPPMPPPQKLAVPTTQEVTAQPSVSARLDGLARRYWTELLQTTRVPLLREGGIGGPMAATALGDHRFDARIDDLSPDGYRRLRDALEQLRTELQSFQGVGLSPEEQLTVQMLRRQMADAQAVQACQGELWVVDQIEGPQIALAQTWLYYPLGTEQGVANLVARYSQAGRLFDQLIANLRRGMFQNRTSAKPNVQRVIATLDDLLKDEGAQLLPPESSFAGLPEAQRAAARERIRKTIVEQVVPGLRRYRAFLATDLLQRARNDIGLWAMTGGDSCYNILVAHHIGTKKLVQDLHDLGVKTLTAVEGEMDKIARGAGAADVKQYRAKLDSSADQHKKSADELLAWHKAMLAHAMAALPKAVHNMPERPIEIRPVEAYRAGSATAVFYQPAPDDGTQPAIYYVNTLRPESRLLYNQEALVFHETIPGHHLQAALAQQLKDLPDFRRRTGDTAFIEGWALYAEHMSDESLQQYSGAPARFGMLSHQAWRAARLVVDTGIHALHWDRERAILFLREHTTLSAEEAANEIDRYAVHPGQALAYMVGEVEMYRLRQTAKQKLGDKFDLREFHDVVLAHGAIPLDALGKVVQDYVEARSGQAKR